MDVFKGYVGKKVFVKLNSDRVYSGVIIKVSDEKNGICFITMQAEKGKATFVSSEIRFIQEEK